MDPAAGPSVGPGGTSDRGSPRIVGYTLAPVRRPGRTDISEIAHAPGGQMAEILTESFCERCGTRYTFEAAAPRAARLLRFRTLSKGLKNYVLSDETSFGEAMAEARSDVDREASGHQLDAFHKTFNFCMSCRQYTCGSCWNGVEGRCLTCAPHLGHEILDAPFRTLDGMEASAAIASNGNGHPLVEPADELDHQPAPWPSADIPQQTTIIDGPAGLTADIAGAITEEPVPEVPLSPLEAVLDPAVDIATGSAEPVAAVMADLPPVVSAEANAVVPSAKASAVVPSAKASAVDHAAASAKARTTDLLARFRPRPARVADEPVAVEAAATPAPESPAPAAATRAEPPAEATESEPPAAETLPAPTEAGPTRSVHRDDHVETPVWRIVAPDGPSTSPPSLTPPAPGPVWPPRPTASAAPGPGPEWPAAAPAQPIQVRGAEAVWAQSSRDVLNRPETGVQACVNCGLPLSATARFCRRCGSNQLSA